jgi:hypothetical protein
MPLAAPILAAVLALAAAPGTVSPYLLPSPAPDAAAQLSEMVGLFDTLCLKAFPDDAAVAAAIAARGGGVTTMTPADVALYLHANPGVGWFLTGRSGRFVVTVEAPPYHACGVRTLTVAGFADLTPYRQLADAFEAGHDARKVAPVSGTVGNVESVGGGESWKRPDGSDEALFVFSTGPAASIRVEGRDGTEVRFVHQIHVR